jgi:exosortase
MPLLFCPWHRLASCFALGYVTARMEEAVTHSAPIVLDRPKRIGWIVAICAFGVVWVELVNQLKAEWSLNPQYNYGLVVPLLALYLFWKRWRSRPAPSSPSLRAFAICAIALGAALFLPVRFVSEANPDWRLLSWTMALLAAGISLCSIYLAGGRPWLRHFAFPVLFFLVAVPWPVRFEQTVIQDLMRVVTAINVTMLQLAGVPALQHGNVIEVGAGFIGIEEACSGVRSLQATLMVSLFLGELYSFRIPRRVILVALGALLAFVCNVIRTAILVWAGTTRGIQSMESWHDPAGLTILVVCLFGLWIASLIMMRRDVPSPISPKIDNQSSRFAWSYSGLAALALWFLLVEAGVQFWYGTHTSIASLRWNVDWPETENDYKQVPITPAAEGMLRYNQGGGASWEQDGRQWMMYFFRWLPGRTAARYVKVHRPDICLPASGRTLQYDNGIRMLEVHGVNLPVRSYRFDDRGTPLHVFYCYWDARSSYATVATAEFEDWSPRGRVRAAVQGRRDIGAQMLEIIVWGYDNDAEARAALARELNRVIHPT